MECFLCGKSPINKLFPCKDCHVISYCSEKCQKQDWLQNSCHQEECPKLGVGLYQLLFLSCSNDNKTKILFNKYVLLKQQAKRCVTEELSMFLHMDYIFTFKDKVEEPWSIFSNKTKVKPHVKRMYNKLKKEYSRFGLGSLYMDGGSGDKLIVAFNKIIEFVYKKEYDEQKYQNGGKIIV